MKKLAHDRFIVLLTFVLCLNLQCSKNNPVTPPDNTFSLMIDDASCTEVFLRLEIGAANSFRTVTLKRDTTTLFTKTLAATETAITDTNLLPAHSYTYHAQLSNGSTAQAQARTMDTTSHSFSFTTTTFGDGTGSSYLLDVAIISDTLAYAVGTIYQAGSMLYNAAIWNGVSWRPMSIPVNFRGSIVTLPLSGVYPLSTTDIWCVGSLPIHGDGMNWIVYDLRSMAGLENMSLAKAWGKSSTDMYFVGNSGSIAHYNGSTWTKIESGTSLDIRDIYGGQKTGTPAREIYATAGNPLIGPDREVFQISGTTVQALSDIGIGGGLNGVWFSPGQYYWIVGDGVWEKHPTLSDATWHSQTLSSYTIDAVRGNGSNDVFMCGAYGECLHFNGVSWKSYQAQTGLGGLYYGLAVHGNIVIAVGEANGLAVITVGRR